MEKYLEAKKCLYKMVTQFYTVDDSQYKDQIKDDSQYKDQIKEEEQIDFHSQYIDVCYHLCESAGEHVWNLLEIEEDVVGVSVFEKKRREFEEQLLKKQEDVKIYKKERDIHFYKKINM